MNENHLNINESELHLYGAPPPGQRWRFPTKTAYARSYLVQEAVLSFERYEDNPIERINNTLAHSRSEIFLINYWQAEHHRQLVNISRGVWILGIVVVIALLVR